MSKSLTIEPALHGGYVVLGASDYGDRRQSLFAGALTDVMEFVRARLADDAAAVAALGDSEVRMAA